VMVKDARPMKYATRRTGGIRWDRWHRMVVMRSLQMMVLNRVVRRAEIDPPQYRDDGADTEADPEASLSMPAVLVDEQGWFTRFFRRGADVLISHERHTI